MERTSITQQLSCGVLAATIHVGMLSCLQAAAVQRATETAERLGREVAPLLVTTFVAENGGPAFRVAGIATPDIATVHTAIVLPFPELPSIDPVAADSFERPREMSSSEDLLTAQRLQGLYVGQIKARLLRLLETVGSVRTNSQSRCLVHVVQDERGQVLDVVSDECEGDAEWQREIHSVIRMASPLPIPPQGLAMGSYLTIDLSAL